MIGKNILRFAILVLIQVFIISNLNLGNYFIPLFYIYFIFKLPFETPGWLLLLLSFFLGISIDFFSGTPGLNASAAVMTAFFRPITTKALSPRNDVEAGQRPSISIMGFKWFFTYTLILSTIHCTTFFFLEVFSFQEISQTILRILGSVAVTTLLIIVTELIFIRKK